METGPASDPGVFALPTDVVAQRRQLHFLQSHCLPEGRGPVTQALPVPVYLELQTGITRDTSRGAPTASAAAAPYRTPTQRSALVARGACAWEDQR